MPAPFVAGADVASTDPEDAGELPGVVERVLLHGFYRVAWHSGRVTTVLVAWAVVCVAMVAGLVTWAVLR